MSSIFLATLRNILLSYVSSPSSSPIHVNIFLSLCSLGFINMDDFNDTYSYSLILLNTSPKYGNLKTEFLQLSYFFQLLSHLSIYLSTQQLHNFLAPYSYTYEINFPSTLLRFISPSVPILLCIRYRSRTFIFLFTTTLLYPRDRSKFYSIAILTVVLQQPLTT